MSTNGKLVPTVMAARFKVTLPNRLPVLLFGPKVVNIENLASAWVCNAMLLTLDKSRLLASASLEIISVSAVLIGVHLRFLRRVGGETVDTKFANVAVERE